MKLSDDIQKFLRLDDIKRKGLDRLKIKTAEDLLRHFPIRYEIVKELKKIADIKKGDLISVSASVVKIEHKAARKKMFFVSAEIHDGVGTMRAVWFNQPYIARMLKEGDEAVFTGKVSQNKKGEFYLSNPVFRKSFEDYSEFSDSKKSEFPVYSETKGVSSKWLQIAVFKILKNLDESEFNDFIPDYILKQYHLPELRKAFLYAHNPKIIKNSEAARKRFAFEEIFLIQLNRILSRVKRNAEPFFKIKSDSKSLKEFTNSLDFKLTHAQEKAVSDILKDFEKNEPMSRLLHGDTGSGKTIVALIAAREAFNNGLQVAYMAPTEILARQHFSTFIKYFPCHAKIGLITSSICEKFPSKVNIGKSAHISKNRLQKWVKDGDINILIGTHSLIQDKVVFKNLGLVIIDEQHRFGVGQRFKIVSKDEKKAPHFLSMSATPIPRTLALTIYGDLDLTLLDEMPAGRKQVITYIVPPLDRHRAYEQIREEIKQGRQAFIVCPRIESSKEGDTIKIEMKAVKEEYLRLSKDVYKEFKLGILHGKLLPKEKEKIMSDFKDKKIDVLISTSVIEVGIDVPNANCILIEGADRFGLSQLHQLRGRVLRSAHQSYCFVLSESNSLNTLKRLNSLKQAKNGFELAEYDLKFRGAGELSGKKQWGVSDLGMEGLKNIKMVEAARLKAAELMREDPELKKYPKLHEKVLNYEKITHWE